MKTEKKVIGKIGSFEVVDFNGTPMLILVNPASKLEIWMSPAKLKTVFAAEAVGKQFLAEYDKPKAPKAPANDVSAQIAAAVAAAMAAAGLDVPAPVKGNGRFVAPVAG